MTTNLDKRIEEAVNKATDAFWAEIARHFPEATSGDIDAGAVFELRRAGMKVTREWVQHNVPQEAKQDF